MEDLERDLEVVGEAATDEAALMLIARTRPQLVLIDLDLPDRSGLETIRDIRGHWATMAIVALTDHNDREYCDAARAAGARDCLDKLAIVDRLPGVLAALDEPPPPAPGATDLADSFEPP